MNILFITADQWRGDSIGYAGHPLVRTPALDALAADGVAFLNHYAQAAPCSPARACLYTGLYQMNNRVCRNGTPLSERFDNIARAARRAGYEPTLFGYTDVSPDPAGRAPKDPDLTTYEGVLPGFEVRVKLPEQQRAWLSWLRAQGLDLPDAHVAQTPVEVEPGAYSPAPPRFSKDQTQTAFVTDEFIRWLGEQDANRPWFAHVSYIRPHPPFIVPEPYNTMFDPADVPGFARAATPDAEAAQHPLLDYALRFATTDSFVFGTADRVRDLSEAAFRQIKATYYGMIAEVDHQIGRALAAIQASGAWDDTLIVFTSDHAEMLGDHYALGKGGYFDGSQHIPLLIRDPQAGVRGTRVSAFTESVDLFPTLLERMGIEPGHWPDGRSLTPFLAGRTPADWRDAVHWEFDFREVASRTAEEWFGLPSTRLNLAVIRTAKWKYVHFAALPPLLFDIENDPANLRNLADDPGYTSARLAMAERLLAWRAEHLDQTYALMELGPQGVVRAS
ncbi:MAG TPA: alkaline phosphatase family protein [Alphaproteobacteria bacterium]|nr:alkaline phosphatase family protein [Alphaproteobacteria bacterium]